MSTRERLHAIRGAPLDERVHVAVAPGPLQPGPAGAAVYVVTHVDVIPPRKDDGLAAVKQLADASRPSSGQRALRGRAADQPTQPLHGRQIWKDAGAVQTHAMAERHAPVPRRAGTDVGRALRRADVPGGGLRAPADRAAALGDDQYDEPRQPPPGVGRAAPAR